MWMRTQASVALALLAAGCASGHGKPVASAAAEQAAEPALERYLQRVLTARGLHDQPVAAVKLLEARLFRDGYYHESWRLKAEVDGAVQLFALKVFPDERAALRSQRNFTAARTFGWPVPVEIDRGPAEPYLPLPALLMLHAEGRTLADSLRQTTDQGKPVEPAEVAALYRELGTRLVAFHKASLRPRQPGDVSGGEAMKSLLWKCEFERWCGPQAQQRFQALVPQLDDDQVAFVHGDLYEAHLVFDDRGTLTRVLGWHDADYADPMQDVGVVLSHMLIIAPVGRQLTLGVPDATPAEMRACAQAFLEAYRSGLQVSDPAWKEMVERAKGYMWLRIGQYVTRLRDNAHARRLVQLLDAQKVALFVVDPFTKYEIAP